MQKMLARLSRSRSTWSKYQVLKQAATHLHTSNVVQRSKEHLYSDMLNPWRTKQDLVEDLANNVVYEDREFIAINKPNGLPMNALKYSEKLPLDVPPPESAELSVASVLPELAALIDAPSLKHIYSQNRLYSGVVILAKNEQAEQQMKKYWRHTRAQKIPYQHYWALTVGIPKDQTMDCQIGIRKQKIQDWWLTVVDSKATKKSRQEGKVIRSRMTHSVLDENPKYDCALVNLQPSATKWDFLEVFLTQQLCVALGDHYYSARIRSIMGKPVLMDPQSSYPAPQVLPDYVLKALDLTKKETEAIPTHIHCYQVDIPVGDGKRSRVKSITAPIPRFFKRTLECLDLRCPTKDRSTDEDTNDRVVVQ